jgi:hypothetical protein
MKDKIDWFDKGKAGAEIVKTSAKAAGIAVGLVAVGVTLGIVGNAFKK